MRRSAVLSSIALSATLVLSPAVAGYFASPTTDLSSYATTQALADAIAGIQAGSTVKQPAVPSTGPGAGLCRQTIVPSELVTSGGVTGTAGTCSRILQCGTSGTYVVTQFNVGSGC